VVAADIFGAASAARQIPNAVNPKILIRRINTGLQPPSQP
jgi:hypothetical protein